MMPILFQLGPIPIHTYGLMIAIGFIVAISVIRRLAARSGLDPDRLADLAFWSLLVGFAGARTLFVITRFEYFAADPLSIFKIWEGGLVFFGGPLAVIPFLVWTLRKGDLPLWKVFDVFAPGLVVAHAFGRIGCIAAGCCYGRPTGSDWGFRFHSELVEESLRGVPLHPTQLYESVSMFILFAGLLWIFRRKRFDGQVVLTYLMAYPVVRSVIETFRGDTVRGFVIDGLLSTSQFISLLVFFAAFVTLLVRNRREGLLTAGASAASASASAVGKKAKARG